MYCTRKQTFLNENASCGVLVTIDVYTTSILKSGYDKVEWGSLQSKPSL